MLVAVKRSDPSNGSVTLNSDGSFTYTPNANFNGTDTFSYQISDVDGNTASATVTITVNSVNDEPVAVADSYSVDEEELLSVSAPGILDNDRVGGDGDTLRVATNTDTSNGQLILNDDGSFTYMPDVGYIGKDQFSYSITDSDGDVASATVVIDVLLASPPSPTIKLNDDITPDDIINSLEESGDVILSGNVGGDAGEGDLVILEFEIEGVVTRFEAVVAADNTFSVSVPGTLLTGDSDKTIQASVSVENEFGIGTATDTESYQVDTAIDADLDILPIGPERSNEIAKAAALGLEVPVTGTVGGDVTDGDEIFIVLNGTEYSGIVENGAFSINVLASDFIEDSDAQIDGSVTITDQAMNTASSSDSESFDVVPVFVAAFTDNFVNGVEYATTSGLSGLTGDAGSDGAFFYRPDDSISFTVGNVIVAEFSGQAIKGDILFLQDVAGVDLSDTNTAYVENMAIFLQALDSDVQDDTPNQGKFETAKIQNSEQSFNSNVSISQSVRDAYESYRDPLADEQLNIVTAGKKMISNALAHMNIVFTRQTEESADLQNVFETIAMNHVTETIQKLAGDRGPVVPDPREVDTLNVPEAVIEYHFNELEGQIEFSTDDLLVDAVGQQVRKENLEVVNVSLSAGYQEIGTIRNIDGSNYIVELVEGFTPYSVEGMSIDYRVYDWTAFADTNSRFRDLFKSHLSAEIQDVPEDVGFLQFTINSELSFESDQELDLEFTSEGMRDLLGFEIAEYGDDFTVPVEYSADGGSSWLSMNQSGIEFNEVGSPMPVFGFVLPANKQSVEIRIGIFDDFKVEPTEFIDMTITGERVYEEKIRAGIIDNDPTNNPLPGLGVNFVYILENAGDAIFSVTLSELAAEPVTVDYRVESLGIAVPGVDFEPVSGTLLIPAGSISEQIVVPIIDDTVVEADPNPEMAIVQLSNPVNAVIEDAQGTLRIFDEDGPSTLDTSIDILPITGDNLIDEDEKNQIVGVSGVVDKTQIAVGFVSLTVNGVSYYKRVSSEGEYVIDIPGTELFADPDLSIEGVVIGFGAMGGKAAASTSESYNIFIDTVPVAADDILNLEEDLTLNLDAPGILANDDIGSNGGVLEVIAFSNPSNGTMSLKPDGSLTYTPNTHFNGIDSFTYDIADIDGDKDTATVTVTVNEVNDPPVLNTAELPAELGEGPDLELNALDGGIIDLNLGDAFSDVDLDALTFTAEGLPPGLSIDAATGVISGVIDSSASQGGVEQDGVYLVTLTVNDGRGGTTEITITINVVNPLPIAVDDVLVIDEDTALTLAAPGLLENDTDPDGDELSVVSVTRAPEVGNAVVLADGNVFYVPPADFSGEVTFDYEMTDADGGKDTATVTVTVNEVNDPPVLNAAELPAELGEGPDFGLDVIDGETVELNLGPAFLDIEANLLNFSAFGLPAGLQIDPDTGLLTGALDLSASQGGQGQSGQYIATVTVLDERGGTTTFEIVINAVNPPPVPGDDTYKVLEDSELVVEGPGILKNDTDPDGDQITILGVARQPESGTLTLNDDGGFIYISEANFNGDVTFVYEIVDSDGAVASATVTISVKEFFDPPVTQDDSYILGEDAGEILMDITANDTDPDSNEFVIEIVDGPANGTTRQDEFGLFFYTPNDDFAGTDTFDYRLIDEAGLVSNLSTVEIRVLAGPKNVLASRGNVMTVFQTLEDVESILTFTPENNPPNDITVTDADSPTLTVRLKVEHGFLAVEKVAGLDFLAGIHQGTREIEMFGEKALLNEALGSLTYRPDRGYLGSDRLIVYTEDEGGPGLLPKRFDEDNDGLDIFVEIRALGGQISSDLSSVLNENDFELANIELLGFDQDIIQTVSVTNDPVGGPQVVFSPKPGQDGSTTPTNIKLQITRLDGTQSEVEIPVTVYQPELIIIQDIEPSIAGSPNLNPQTGLFEQVIRIANNTPFDFKRMRIYLENVPATVKLMLETKSDEIGEYVEVDLNTRYGESARIVLEYFSRDGRAFQAPKLTLLVSGANADFGPSPETISGIVDTSCFVSVGAFGQLESCYISFATVQGKKYWIEYSDNLEEWNLVFSPVVGTGETVIWQDSGPPKTRPLPSESGSGRYYRVLEQNIESNE